MVPAPCQNSVAVCDKITLLIFTILARLVTLLKVIGVPAQVSGIFILLLVSNSSILGFRYSFFFS
jgi:hypothetical protein